VTLANELPISLDLVYKSAHEVSCVS